MILVSSQRPMQSTKLELSYKDAESILCTSNIFTDTTKATYSSMVTKNNGNKASTSFKLSSLQVVFTLWRNASTSRKTFFKHQELERYPLSPNMTKIITCLLFPLVSTLDGRKGETRVGVVDSVK